MHPASRLLRAAGRAGFFDQSALLRWGERAPAQPDQGRHAVVWPVTAPAALSSERVGQCPTLQPGSKRVSRERTSMAPQALQRNWVRRPPPERQVVSPSLMAVRPACGRSCQARFHTSIRHGPQGCLMGVLHSSETRNAGTHTRVGPLAPPPSYVPTVRTATWMSASEVSAPPTAGRATKRDKEKLNRNLGRNAAPTRHC